MRLAVLALAAVGLFALACDDDGDGGGGDGKLQAVIDRGELRCGVNDGVPGFGFVDADGNFSGFDVDFCRAVAAATIGDPNAVEFIPLSAGARFDALAQDEIDVLIRNTTWTANRDGELGAAFTLTTFYDGQGMMVRSDSGITSIDDMANATVCVLRGTTTEGNLEDRFAASDVPYTPLAFDDLDTLEAAFREERCDGWTSDQSQLAARRSAYPAEEGGPDSLTILSEVFSKEPLGPSVRDGDQEWFDLVNWVVIGMIQADELGVSSENVEEQIANPRNIDVARLLGVEFEGEATTNYQLGVPDTFMQEVLRQVGNYDEVYERNIVPIGIPREGTLNASWRDGGILYAPPMR